MKAQTEKSELKFSSTELAERAIYRRAVEVVVWGMPAVNSDLMYQAMVRETSGGWNQIVYWSRLLDWKNQTLTPNPDAIYIMPFFNTADVGPMVIEIPPANGGSITGSIMDVWQTPLEDVGPAGVDAGKGGKYLILPPDYNGAVPDGYIPLPCQTYQGYALLRSILKSGSAEDFTNAVSYGKHIRFYPLTAAANPPATTWLDAIDVVFDATIPYDLRFFESLARIVASQPWLERDRAMIDSLKTLGIEKGKPFNPDARRREILSSAAEEARQWLDIKYEASLSPPFYEGGHWALPANPEMLKGMQSSYADPDSYPVDGRGMTYSMAFFCPKRPAAGSYYLMTTRDKDGQPFDGGSNYRLSVPAAVPVRQYWSATVYDRATHGLIRDVHRASRSSQVPELQVNRDGAVDVYFGPAAPVGKESNWIPTQANRGFEVLFRFYGPDKSLFEKKWKLPDIERLPK
ncbi:MAG TPA: DUF1254 domain-containing protein [Pyrinomonadaceae bacterium]